MTGVRVSVSSLAARNERLQQQTRRKACRNLFGPVDHVALDRELNAKLSEISERDQDRWNFNFACATPLHGDYEWERAAVDTTPAFYQSVQAGEKRAAALPPAEAPNRGSCSRRGAAGGTISSDKTRAGKRSCTERKTSTRLTTTTTTRITDFYIKRKKRGEHKPRESPTPNPLSFLSTEQTPRKGLR